MLSTLLQGCAYQWLDWTVPEDGYQRFEVAEYGNNKRQQLSIYYPQQRLANSPVLVFFYGGSWSSGKKENYRFVAQAFTKAGYITVIPDYRVYPQVRFPQFISDAASAISWLQQQQLTDQGVVLMGHSAGAHIAALLAFDQQWLQQAGVKEGTVQALIGYSGPYAEFKLSSKKLRGIFADTEPLEQVWPLSYVDQNAPPSLLIHGADDSTVLPEHSKKLAQKLQQQDIAVTTVYYPDTGHIATAAALATPLRGWCNSYADSLAFLSTLNSSSE